MSVLGDLRRVGVLGINRRNVDYTLRWNRRRLYKNVDDKLLTKQLCHAAGIPVPRLLAVARHHFEVRDLPEKMGAEQSFVLKPARGAMGNGILVVDRREEPDRLEVGSRWIRMSDLRYHAASIISGLYSLGGQSDEALVEERLRVHPELAEISSRGVPDIRVIVYRGVPIMAMTRLPTLRANGRANLHQGAVGVGVDLATGRTLHAVLRNAAVTHHPDTGQPLLGRTLPAFERVLEIAVRAADQTGLGYVGADVVVDAAAGPVILELNARPGLVVQVANRQGLLPRLHAVDASDAPGRSVEGRVEFGRGLSETGP